VSEFRQSLERQTIQARRSARLGWSVAAVLVLAGGGGLWWSTKAITAAQARLDVQADRIDDLATTADVERSRAAELQADLATAIQVKHQAELAVQDARLQAAKVSAKLEDAQDRLHGLQLGPLTTTTPIRPDRF